MILNFFRKPTFALLLSFIMLTFSCTSNRAGEENTKFNYEAFNSFKTTGFDFNIPTELKDSPNSVAKMQGFVDIINKKYNTDLTVNSYDINQIESKYQQRSSYSTNNDNVFTETDIILMDKLNSDIDKVGFEEAMKNFELNVVQLKLEDKEFSKYNLFASDISIIHYVNPEVFNQNGPGVPRLTSCQKAIIANALATVGLAACGTGLFCALAIAGKILALDAVLDSCAKKPFL